MLNRSRKILTVLLALSLPVSAIAAENLLCQTLEGPQLDLSPWIDREMAGAPPVLKYAANLSAQYFLTVRRWPLEFFLKNASVRFNSQTVGSKTFLDVKVYLNTGTNHVLFTLREGSRSEIASMEEVDSADGAFGNDLFQAAFPNRSLPVAPEPESPESILARTVVKNLSNPAVFEEGRNPFSLYGRLHQDLNQLMGDFDEADRRLWVYKNFGRFSPLSNNLNFGLEESDTFFGALVHEMREQYLYKESDWARQVEKLIESGLEIKHRIGTVSFTGQTTQADRQQMEKALIQLEAYSSETRPGLLSSLLEPLLTIPREHAIQLLGSAGVELWMINQTQNDSGFAHSVATWLKKQYSPKLIQRLAAELRDYHLLGDTLEKLE
jgi:hypothetical protein